MKKVSFWSILGMIGKLAKELNAAAEDGKITIREALIIIESLCTELGIDFDDEGLNVDDLVEEAGKLVEKAKKKIDKI